MRLDSQQKEGGIHNSSVEAVDPEMAAFLRTRSPAERFETLNQLWHHARDLLDSQLRQDHPEWSAKDRAQEVARRLSNGSW